MIGHQQIIEARSSGMKPSCVFVNYGKESYEIGKGLCKTRFHPENDMAYDMHPTVYIDDGSIPDIRFLLGCNVIFTCDKATESAKRIAKKIVEMKPGYMAYLERETGNFGLYSDGKWKK